MGCTRPAERVTHVRSQRNVALWTALGALWLLLVVVPGPRAAADGPTTFSNTTSIAIPATGSPNQIGPASPYPSSISVSGMAGSVSSVSVRFNNLTHGAVNDIDALLVAPTGQNLVVLSDIGDPSTLAFATNATLTLSDSAAGPVPTGNIPTGTYRPTNNGTTDTFPAPAPSPSSQTTLGGAFTGINPNGTWQLFVVDDATGDLGAMNGGWSLIVTTQVAALPTTTVVTTSGTPSTTGTSVTFTATVRAGTTPVTTGTVQFADGVNNLGGPVALDGSGVALLATSALAEGSHEIRGTYSGATGFLSSNGTVAQRVDNPTVETGDTYCNLGPLSVPNVGPATPYPSNITIAGRTGLITKVTATLKGVSHSAPIDLDVLLAGPQPTTNVTLLSDSGGQAAVSSLQVSFDDDAAGLVPNPMVTGTFRPTDDDAGGADSWPAPAPAPASGTTLGSFAGTSPNGTWSLWVNDDATGDPGSITGGWCLTVTTTSATPTPTPTPTATGTPTPSPAPSPPVTPETSISLSTSKNPAIKGKKVTLKATVTSGGLPVTTGAVQFSDGGKQMGGPVPLTLDGTARLVTKTLSVKTHQISASFTGAGHASSSTALIQVVLPAPARLTLVTVVVNDDGGHAHRRDWRLSAKGPVKVVGVSGSKAVTKVSVPPGTYALKAARGPAGYRTSAWSCSGASVHQGKVKLKQGSTVVCTVTQNDRP